MTFTVGGSQEPLQESNYHSLETEHDIVAELADHEAPADEDVTTVDGLKARRERLSTGEGARSRCEVHLAIDVVLIYPSDRVLRVQAGSIYLRTIRLATPLSRSTFVSRDARSLCWPIHRSSSLCS